MFDEVMTLNEVKYSGSFSTLPSNIRGDSPMFFVVIYPENNYTNHIFFPGFA